VKSWASEDSKRLAISDRFAHSAGAGGSIPKDGHSSNVFCRTALFPIVPRTLSSDSPPLPGDNSATQNSNGSILGLIIGVVIGVIALLVISFIVIFLMMKPSEHLPGSHYEPEPDAHEMQVDDGLESLDAWASAKGDDAGDFCDDAEETPGFFEGFRIGFTK
jgi:hypothetical protein